MNVKDFRDKYPDQFRKAYNEWCSEGLGYEWYDCVYQDAIENGKALGFDIEGINFSGFWSQGDGACWFGDVFLADYIKAHCDISEPKYHVMLALIAEGHIDNRVTIRTSGRYSHENTMHLTYDVSFLSPFADETMREGVYQGALAGDLMELIEHDIPDLENEILDAARGYAADIYNQLEEEYNNLTREESYIDYCECNEVEFDVCDVEEV